MVPRLPMCLPLLSAKPVLKDLLLLLKMKMFQTLPNQKLHRTVRRAMLSYSSSVRTTRFSCPRQTLRYGSSRYSSNVRSNSSTAQMTDKALVGDSAPAQVENRSPVRISIVTARRPSDINPFAANSPSAHHSDSVIYGDEVLYVEDELKYPYPRERPPLFSTGVGIKGPLFNRNTHPLFFRESPYNKPEHLILLDSRLKNRRYTTLVFFMTA